MRAIDENNRRPICGRTGWMGDVSGNPFGPFEGPDDPDANTPSPEAKP